MEIGEKPSSFASARLVELFENYGLFLASNSGIDGRI